MTLPAPQLTVALPSWAVEGATDWQRLLDLADAAELAGVDRVSVSDHVVFGERLEEYGRAEVGGAAGGRQPTGPDGNWLEPLIVLAIVAGRTRRVRLSTSILLAALRRPVVLAKQAATLDVLSGGRLDLGVGVGWQREEYEAAGLDFSQRGRLLDHAMEVCTTLWTQERANYRSTELTFQAIHQMPKPVQPGGVPIWVSGRVHQRTANRLARFGTGWIPWGPDAQDLGSIARMREAVSACGGDASTMQVVWQLPLPWRADGTLDVPDAMRSVEAMTAAGVTSVQAVIRKLPANPLPVLREVVHHFRSVTGREPVVYT